MFLGIRIHADHAERQDERLQLHGVAIVQLDRKKIDQIITAQYAEVDFEIEKHDHRIAIYLRDATLLQDEDAIFLGNQSLFIEFPSLWRDKIEFKTLEQSKAIRQDMTQFELIRKFTTDVHQQFLVERFFEYCDERLGEGKYLILEKGADRLHVEAQGAEMQQPTKKENIRLADKNRTTFRPEHLKSSVIY